MPLMPSAPVAEKVDRAIFEHEIKPLNRPVIMKGVAAEWPCVERGAESPRALANYLKMHDTGAQLPVSICPAAFKGSFFYNADMTGFNFSHTKRTLSQIVDLCIAENGGDAYYLQGMPFAEAAPGLVGAVNLGLFDPAVQPRLWLGNSLRTQTHFDTSDNVAVHIAGDKLFTLFPPEQIGNLYPGPVELTPAGVPISMVQLDAPDFERYPRFRRALEAAEVARLEPGDALYMPALWWHHVSTDGPLNMLVNHWWTERRLDAYSPMSALYMAALSYKHMPAGERRAWGAVLNYFIFNDAGEPMAHLPEHVHSVFGPNLSEGQMERFKAAFRRSINA